MKQVNLTINVSDNKFNQLIEFLSKNFGSVTVTEEVDFDVSQWQKDIVSERKKTKKENYLSVDSLNDEIKLQK